MPEHFEAKKHAYRQTQDGIVVSFVVHPNDVSAVLAVSPLGTRYMVAFAEIGEDGNPTGMASTGQKPETIRTGDALVADKTEPANKERKPFNTLRPSAQAGIRCGDDDFKWFLMDAFPVTAAKHKEVPNMVRAICAVTSRAELDSNEIAGMRWSIIEEKYQSWRTDRLYAASAR